MFVSKKKFLKALNDFAALESQHTCLKELYTEKENEEAAYRKEIAEMKIQIEALNEYIERKETVYGSSNVVKLAISDDLTHVIPHITVKSQMFEKMVQMGMLDDTVTPDTKPTAMQLALMSIALEALETLSKQFSNRVEKED